MHEILFRGKRTDFNRWIEGYLYRLSEKLNPFIMLKNQYGMGFEVIPETIGQFTGLTDKNGKKIFDGDILQTGTRMGYVIWNEGCFRFRWKNFDKYRGDFFKTCILTEYGSFEELKVIGNIQDNPEFLEEGGSE